MEGSYTQAELKGLLLCTNWLEDFQYDEAHGHLNESDQAAEDEAEEAAAGAIFDVAAEEALIGLGAPELHQAGPVVVWSGTPIHTLVEEVAKEGEREGEKVEAFVRGKRQRGDGCTSNDN
jgi:hypothetical protein